MKPLEPKDPILAQTFFYDKLSFTISPVDLKLLIDATLAPNLVDVRPEASFLAGHIAQAKNLPESDWNSGLNITKQQTNVFYGHSLITSDAARAALFFSQLGFPVMELLGGIEGWKNSGFALDRIEIVTEKPAA